MLGLMQSQPLLISSLIEFAQRHHADGEIVSRRVEGDIHRYTWADVAKRSKQVAGALDSRSGSSAPHGVPAGQAHQAVNFSTCDWRVYKKSITALR